MQSDMSRATTITTLCSLSGKVIRSYTQGAPLSIIDLPYIVRKPHKDILASIETTQSFILFVLSTKSSLWMPHSQSIRYCFLEHHFTTVMSNLGCNMKQPELANAAGGEGASVDVHTCVC